MADDFESGRKLRTKQRKKYNDQDIDEDDIDGRRLYSVEDKLVSGDFQSNMVQELKGPDFTMEWMQKNGLTHPIVFYDKTGLGLRVPSENFKVSDVKQCVGSRRILDVMDVTTQKAMEMSMKEWVKYYENKERDRLLNVISLEFCHTRLENYVESPTLVRQIDWVDRAWPRHLKECQTESTNVIEKMKYPKVQKYCLMSVAGCYTDFHIDFGGTSVWYHILHGEKIFWLAPPSQKNIDRYVEWTLSARQGESFLGDTLECCQRIQLLAGYTFIIPSGWIHAVYTPKDSLVFGGNFLHSYNVENQLLVSRVEDKTYVPSKFKYPFYQEIMWYVVDRYLSCLTGRTYLATGAGDKDEGYDDEDQGLIHVDEDSRPPSRNPDSRPPSRAMEDGKPEKEEEAPKISKSVTIELTRIDAGAAKRSPSEDENQPPISAQGRPRGPRKAASDPNNSWEGGGPKKWINLTTTELQGVMQLLDYLSGLLSLPLSKRGVPKDLLDPEALLKELRQVLEDHKADDQNLSVTGEPVIGWPELVKKKQKLKLGYKTYKTPKASKGGQTPSSAASSNVQRRRRTRCKKCEACTRTECGECTFCKDMKKFGGPGRMKQTCISRQCMAPILPSASMCMLCNQGDQSNSEDLDDISMSLMECGICWEIVHPKCLRKKYESLESDGVVNEDLPSSWECIKCCNEGKQGQLKARPKPGFSTKKAKSEDSEGSQEEEGGGPLSPMTPVEGKRVTAKEGGGGAKCEFGTPIKWPNSGKRCSPMSESNIKKEGDDALAGSPSPHSGDENRQASSFSPSHQKEQKKNKREKSPTSNQGHQEDCARGPKKRQTPEQQQQQQQPGIASKRSKREKTGSNTDPSPRQKKTGKGKRKSEEAAIFKEDTPSKKLKIEERKCKRRSSKIKDENDEMRDTESRGDESRKISRLKGTGQVKDKIAVAEETKTVSSVTLKISTLKNGDTPYSKSLKLLKHVTFEDSVQNCAVENDKDASNLSSVSSEKYLNDVSLNEEIVQEGHSRNWDLKAFEDTESRLAQDLARQIDSIRGHRLGKRPMYRGNADWSKDYVPPAKMSKSLFRVTGLQRRQRLDDGATAEGKRYKNCEENKCSEKILCSKHSELTDLSWLTGSAIKLPVVAENSVIPAGDSNSLPLGATVDVAVASIAPSQPLNSHTSEGASMGSEPSSTNATTTHTSTDNSENFTATAKTQTALMLVQKLRDTLVSNSKVSQVQNLSLPQSLPHVSENLPTELEHHATGTSVQRIIVKDCSVLPLLDSSDGQTGNSTTPKLQTVIVKKLQRNQPRSSSTSSSSPQQSSDTMQSSQNFSSCYKHAVNQPDERQVAANCHRSGMHEDSLNRISKSPSVTNTIKDSACVANLSQRSRVKSCGNLFDNVFNSINPSAVEKVEVVNNTSSHLTSDFKNSQIKGHEKINGWQQQTGTETNHHCIESQQNNLVLADSNALEDRPMSQGPVQINVAYATSKKDTSVAALQNSLGDHCSKTNTSAALSQNNLNDNGIKTSTCTPGESLIQSGIVETFESNIYFSPNENICSNSQDFSKLCENQKIFKQVDIDLGASHTEQNGVVTEDIQLLLDCSNQMLQQDKQQNNTDMKEQEGLTQVVVGSPPGNYQPLLFDHPYCQTSAASDTS